jgi:hypothetical protein
MLFLLCFYFGSWMFYGRDAEHHKAATCPLTRVPLRPTHFIFNTSLQDEIEEWKLQHGMSLYDDDDEEESGVNASLEEEEEDNDETSTEHASVRMAEDASRHPASQKKGMACILQKKKRKATIIVAKGFLAPRGWICRI